MNNVFPEAMNPLPEDPKEAIKVMEKYIRYMCERMDFAMRRERGLTEVPEAEVVERLVQVEHKEAATSQEAHQAYQLANTATTELENKVDKDGDKVLSDNNYTDTDKTAVGTIGDKVDKETGKGLSTEDYTTAEKNKLSGLVEVEANPSGSATGTMTTVRVGDTVYNLPSGGSYTLPLAADGTRGGIQLGYTASGKNYPVAVSNEKAYVNVPWENTTYSNATTSAAGLMSAADKTKLNGIATNANNYSLPTASDSTKGGIKTNFTQTGKKYPVEVSSENAYVEVPWTDHTYSNATTDSAGLMSAADKTKLNGIATGATKNTIDSSMSSSSTNAVQNKVVNTALGDKVKFISASGSYTYSGSGWKYTGVSITIPKGYKALVVGVGADCYKAISSDSSPSQAGIYISVRYLNEICGYAGEGTRYLHVNYAPESSKTYRLYALCVKT